MNLQATLLLMLRAGGPGSGRHPSVDEFRKHFESTDKKFLPIPMQSTDRPISDKRYKEALRTATEASVNPKDLTAVQPDISVRTLKEHLGREQHKDWLSLPIVVKHGGKLLIMDGHHRIVTSMLRGEEAVQVRLVDMSKKK